MLWFRRRPKRLNLALQGGGAHGAFTWGVLDQLLLDEMTAVGWVSGTSAGALNAVALAHGLANGGRAVARETLEAVWSDVEASGVPDFLSLNPLLLSFTRATQTNLNGLLSPYSFNPLGFDPLRTILEKRVDFDAIRRNKAVRVSVAATDVSTGKARIFSGEELTIEAVLASACLPTLHHAVMIGGRAYWDGGFSANPDVLSLALESPVHDTLIVLLNPLLAPEVPLTAREIEDRVNTITFNQPLLRDIDTIVRAKTMQPGWFAPRADGAGAAEAAPLPSDRGGAAYGAAWRRDQGHSGPGGVASALYGRRYGGGAVAWPQCALRRAAGDGEPAGSLQR